MDLSLKEEGGLLQACDRRKAQYGKPLGGAGLILEEMRGRWPPVPSPFERRSARLKSDQGKPQPSQPI